MKSSILKIVFGLAFLNLSAAWASVSCEQIISPKTQEVVFSSSKVKIATPESIPTVRGALKKIDSLIARAQKKSGTLQSIYKKALPMMAALKVQGDEIVQAGAPDQDRVYDFFYKFSSLIDLPAEYADSIGYYADGFDTIHRFTEVEFQKRLQSFYEKFTTTEPLLDHEINKLDKPPRDHLTSSFQYISVGKTQLPDDLKFSFQYKFIFKKGLLTLLDLFKERETGKAYVGVSFREDAEYDGQSGDAIGFLRHDVLHAFTQKYFDELLFTEFRATTIAKKSKLKTKTNALLQARINEYQAITDADLKAAIEIGYFALLHEQSKTYPIGVVSDLATDYDFYMKAIPNNIEREVFGKENKDLTVETVKKSLEWIKIRAEEDAQKLRSEYGR